MWVVKIKVKIAETLSSVRNNTLLISHAQGTILCGFE